MNMGEIRYLKSALKSLLEYDKTTGKRLVEAINAIPKGDIKKLQGVKNPPLYRLRVGKYRIVYSICEEDIVISKVDTRGDVYK